MIHDFSDVEFKALDPKWRGDRPRTISEQVRRRICLVARCCPRDLGLAFSTLNQARGLPGRRIIAVRRESTRQILRDGRVSWQVTKTWKFPPTWTSSRRCTTSWIFTITRRRTGE